MKKWIVFVFLICLSFFSNKGTSQNTDKTQSENFILIIHSHAYESPWGTDVAKMIHHKLKAYDSTLIVKTVHADITMERTYTLARLKTSGAISRGKLNENIYLPSLVVFINEDTWMFYRIMVLNGVWDRLPVVICNTSPLILKDVRTYFQNKSFSDSLMISVEKSSNGIPITGNLNNPSFYYQKTIELIQQLKPNVNTLTFVSDNNYSDNYCLYNLKKLLINHFPQYKLNILTEDNTDSIRQVLHKLPQNSVVVVNSFYPEYCNVPVFTLTDHAPKDNFTVGGFFGSRQNFSDATAESIIKIRQGTDTNSIPFHFVNGSNFLNQSALNHFNLNRKVKQIDNVKFFNIPEPFFIRNLRIITIIVISIIVLTGIIRSQVRAKRMQKKMNIYRDKYEQLYSEFQIIYNNIPVGLIEYDDDGNLVSRNPESNLFFDQLPETDKALEHNIFKSNLFGNNLRERIKENDELKIDLSLNKHFFKIYFKKFSEAETENKNIILVLIIDNTDLEMEKSGVELLSDIIHFTTKEAAIGVAEYNQITQMGYSTDAWYSNFGTTSNCTLDEIFTNVIPIDKLKINKFLIQASKNKAKLFDKSILVCYNNEQHWLRCVIQVKEYAPEKGIIQLVGLCMNIDKQKMLEQNLTLLMKKAKESERLKKEFISNAKDDIKIPLHEISFLSEKILSSKKFSEKEKLHLFISKNSTILLDLIQDIINKSKEIARK